MSETASLSPRLQSLITISATPETLAVYTLHRRRQIVWTGLSRVPLPRTVAQPSCHFRSSAVSLWQTFVGEEHVTTPETSAQEAITSGTLALKNTTNEDS